MANTCELPDVSVLTGESEYCIGLVGRASVVVLDDDGTACGCFAPVENHLSTGNADCDSPGLCDLFRGLDSSASILRFKDIAE